MAFPRLDYSVYTEPGPYPLSAGIKWRVYPVGGATGGPVVPVPPVIDNVTPADGTAITITTAIGFNVTDALNGLLKVIITAAFAGGTPEVVFDGTVFSAPYLAGSTKVAITNGFQFSLLRTGGWLGAISINAQAFDTEGAEAV